MHLAKYTSRQLLAHFYICSHYWIDQRIVSKNMYMEKNPQTFHILM